MPHVGSCFCGAVTVEAAGEPEEMGYCHCASCRAWSGTPVVAFSLWQTEAVTITRGEEHLASFAKTSFSERCFCSRCGGHLLSRHPSIGMVDIAAMILPSLDFRPTVHLNYAETVLPMADGLPKLRDFPAEAGGSGELIAE